VAKKGEKLSDEERKEKVKAYNKAYREKPENIARKRAIEQTPEYKAKRRVYERTPERISKRKLYYRTSEYKSERKLYNAKPENIEKVRAKRNTPENLAKAKARYQTPEFKMMARKSDRRPERIARKKSISFKLKMKVFTHYSKTISNSDVPCCACCLYNDIRGLSLDHIMPISKQSASEKLLPKTGDGLWNYLKNKGYPEGYQILCHICNKMKDTKPECPHQLDKVRTYCEIKEMKNLKRIRK